MDIRVFKMINGEEVIADVKKIDNETYTVESPAVIMLQQTQSGQMGVGIAPYMPYISGEVIIRKTAIASEGIPEIKMQNEYSRLFGSGIEIAPANALVGL